MKHRKLRLAIAGILAGTAGSMTQVSWAQGSLEEIVVTATRTATNVQDLPVAITAITAETLVDQNIENVQDLTAVVPNVLIRGGTGGTGTAQINMRGIPNVGTYVDGVWQVSTAGLLQRQFVELERVEVLRGPQGTLYGRDSTGGSIHIFTQPPQEEFGATIDLGVGAFDRRDISVSADIPLADTFTTKWTLASYDRDGYVRSRTTGNSTGDLENQLLRGDFLWTPTDRFGARLIRQEDDQVATTARVQTYIRPQVAYDYGWQVGLAEAHDIAGLAGPTGVGFNNFNTVAGYPGGDLGEFESLTASTTPDRQSLEQTTLHLDYDITDSLHLKYVYGGTDVQSSIYIDWGGTAYNYFVNYGLTDVELDSHEIQFSGGSDRFSWVAGAFSWEQTTKTRGVEWSMSDWMHAPPAGARQILDYADVLASPTCTQQTAQMTGNDFDGRVRTSGGPALVGTIVGPADGDNGLGPVADSWVLPCSAGHALAPFGSAFNSTDGTDGSDRSSREVTDGFAVFGEVTFDLSDRWDITLGYRFHDQTEKDWAQDLDAGFALGVTELRPILLDTEFRSFDRGVNAPIDPSSLTEVSFDHSTVRFATTYQINNNIMVYAGYSEGFNSGGIDVAEDSQGRFLTQYEPETIENWELGLRGDFVNGRLRVNATYFDTSWIDIQLGASVIDRTTLEPITETVTSNAAEGIAEGIEVELNFAATDDLLLGFNLGLLDTQYVGIAPGAEVDLNTEFGGAPETTYMLNAQYDWNLGNGGNLMARLQASYQDRYWRSTIPNRRQDFYSNFERDTQAGDFWTLSTRLTYTPPSGNYEISAWGNNLTDAYNINSGFMDSIWQFDFGGVDAPREVGVSMRMFFD